jgi:hypothetical protein
MYGLALIWGNKFTTTLVVKLHVEFGLCTGKIKNFIFGEQTERHKVMNCTAAQTEGYELHSSTDRRL